MTCPKTWQETGVTGTAALAIPLRLPLAMRRISLVRCIACDAPSRLRRHGGVRTL